MMKNLGKIRIWLAGNSISSRSNCRTILTGCPSLECVGESDLSCTALAQIEAARPDVVILDIDTHDRRTNRILQRLKHSIPTTHIIAHSSIGDKRFVMRLLRYGVHGYISSREIATELTRAIYAVMQGDVFLCPTASGALVTEYRKHSRLRKHGDSTSRTSTYTLKEKGT